MVQLLAFGKHNNWTSFEKHMRDDVNWDSCDLPWRRSSKWIVLQVALQTILQRAFPQREGYIQYKNFMLYLVSEIGMMMIKNAVNPDQLAIVRAKVGRLLYKLGEKVYGFVADYAQSCEKSIADRLHAIKLDIKKADRMIVPHFSAAGKNDLQMSLKNCREYLRSVFQQTPAKIEPIHFDRRHGQRNQRDKYGLPVLESGDIVSLADLESWVEKKKTDGLGSKCATFR